jgi:hypothetical protein
MKVPQKRVRILENRKTMVEMVPVMVEIVEMEMVEMVEMKAKV